MPRRASFRPVMVSRPDLAKCGLVAGLMWFQGRARCDSYGRLPAHPDRLLGDVMFQWMLKGKVARQEIEEAREQLIAAGLWYFYEVNGEAYVEYVGWDADYPPSVLRRRGRPVHPDPPDREDLWVRNRPSGISRYRAAKVPAGQSLPA
jgi:hypothetical protein